MKNKSCCVTGHRDIPKDKLPYVEEELRKAVKAAVKDGFTRFISGLDEGEEQIISVNFEELEYEHLLDYRVLYQKVETYAV